jgi:hypothetical protein
MSAQRQSARCSTARFRWGEDRVSVSYPFQHLLGLLVCLLQPEKVLRAHMCTALSVSGN